MSRSWIVTWVLAVGAGCACAPSPQGVAGETPSPAAADAATNPRERAVPVRTRVIRAQPFVDRFEVTGAVRPWREYALASEFGGLVREVAFERGDRVEADQVLARIGDDLARARLDQAEADLLASAANFEKVSRLVERDAVPKQDLVAATARRDRDRAIVAEAEVRLDRATIRSPATGRVTERSVDPGEVVAPGAPVAVVHETRRLKIEASVPDTEIAWLQNGGSGRVRVDAAPGRAFEAAIVYVAPAADPVTRTFTVELEAPNDTRTLRPGMVVRVELDRKSLERAVAVPLDALITRVEGTSAFVVRDCHAERREVATGGREGDEVLVLSGLEEGDELVVDGHRDLADGQRIRSETCP